MKIKMSYKMNKTNLYTMFIALLVLVGCNKLSHRNYMQQEFGDQDQGIFNIDDDQTVKLEITPLNEKIQNDDTKSKVEVTSKKEDEKEFITTTNKNSTQYRNHNRDGLIGGALGGLTGVLITSKEYSSVGVTLTAGVVGGFIGYYLGKPLGGSSSSSVFFRNFVLSLVVCGAVASKAQGRYTLNNEQSIR